MSSNLLWELTEDAHNTVRGSDMAITDLLQMPVVRWYEAEPNLVGLTLHDAQFLVWGIDAMAIGNIPRALGMFEQRLLPLSLDRPPVWRSSLLMWSAICRLYLCDTAMALAHIQTAHQHGMTKAMPEFELLKGMALRLDGHLEGAIDSLNILARKRGLLFPVYRFHSRAWLFETMAAVGDLTYQAASSVAYARKHTPLRNNRNNRYRCCYDLSYISFPQTAIRTRLLA